MQRRAVLEAMQILRFGNVYEGQREKDQKREGTRRSEEDGCGC